MKLNLQPLFRLQADEAKQQMALWLLGGRGVGGRFLRPKKIPNGRPLGFGKTTTGIPGRLRRGRRVVVENGWDVHHDVRTDWFDRGAGYAPARPVRGYTKKQADAWAKQAANEAALQITVAARSA